MGPARNSAQTSHTVSVTVTPQVSARVEKTVPSAIDTADATIFDWLADRRKPAPAEDTDVVRMLLNFRYRTARP